MEDGRTGMPVADSSRSSLLAGWVLPTLADPAADLAAGEALMEKTEEKSKGEKLGRFASDQRRPRHTRVGVLDPETEPVRLLSFGHSVDGENHTGIMTGSFASPHSSRVPPTA